MASRFAAVITFTTLVLAACGGGSDSADGTTPDTDVVADSAPTTDAEPVDTAAPPDTSAPVDTTADTEPPPHEPTEATCAVADGPASATEFDEVSCDTAHDAEFAGSVPAPDGTSPADDVAYDIALSTTCLDTVVDLLGEPLDQFGPEVAYRTDAAPGDEFSGDVDCWVRSPAVGSMTGSLRDADFATVLGDYITLGSLEVGECYLAAPENSGSISVGTLEDCSTDGVDLFLGRVTIDDGPFPGPDALFALGDEECPAVAEASGLELIGDTVGAIAMSETEWTVLGIRDLLCMSYDSDGDGYCAASDPEGDSIRYDDEVPCDEPHEAQFAGYVTAPFDALPEDEDEAAFLLRQVCRESAEQLAGRDVTESGFQVGFNTFTGLGEPLTDDVECYVEGSGTDLLIGNMAINGLESAYEPSVIIADLEPGTCFVFLLDSFDVGDVTDCGAPDALMVVGRFDAELDEYPGLDALRDLRTQECTAILAESGLAVDPASVSGTIVNVEAWEAFGSRHITCDGVPL